MLVIFYLLFAPSIALLFFATISSPFFLYSFSVQCSSSRSDVDRYRLRVADLRNSTIARDGGSCLPRFTRGVVLLTLSLYILSSSSSPPSSSSLEVICIGKVLTLSCPAATWAIIICFARLRKKTCVAASRCRARFDCYAAFRLDEVPSNTNTAYIP